MYDKRRNSLFFISLCVLLTGFGHWDTFSATNFYLFNKILLSISDEIQLDNLRTRMIHDEEERSILKSKIADVSKVSTICYLVRYIHQYFHFNGVTFSISLVCIGDKLPRMTGSLKEREIT